MSIVAPHGNTLIKFYLGGKLLGQGRVCEHSRSPDRIALAKSLGIKYYDRFVFPRRKLTLDSAKVFIARPGTKKLRPFNDFDWV